MISCSVSGGFHARCPLRLYNGPPFHLGEVCESFPREHSGRTDPRPLWAGSAGRVDNRGLNQSPCMSPRSRTKVLDRCHLLDELSKEVSERETMSEKTVPKTQSVRQRGIRKHGTQDKNRVKEWCWTKLCPTSSSSVWPSNVKIHLVIFLMIIIFSLPMVNTKAKPNAIDVGKIYSLPILSKSCHLSALC